MNSRVRILGVDVDNLGPEELLARVEGFVCSGRPHHIVTLNPEFLVMARTDAEFRRVLQGADLALVDGIGLIWASYILRRPLQGRLPGVDVMRMMAGLAARRGYRLFLLGAGEGIAERAARVLAAENPGLEVAGTYAGSPTVAEEDGIVEMVRASGADILFVAYGAPVQDMWIARNLERLGVRLAMGVGGSFDYISGTVRRAPGWMCRMGLEWLFRLVREPWRWRRMMRLPRFAWLVLASALRPGAAMEGE